MAMPNAMYNWKAKLALCQILTETLTLHILLIGQIDQIISYLKIHSQIIHKRYKVYIFTGGCKGLEETDCEVEETSENE